MIGPVLDEIMRDDGYTDVRDLVHTDDLTLPIPDNDDEDSDAQLSEIPVRVRRSGPPRKIAPHVVREIYESATPYRVAQAHGVSAGAASSILTRISHKDVTRGLRRGTESGGNGGAR